MLNEMISNVPARTTVGLSPIYLNLQATLAIYCRQKLAADPNVFYGRKAFLLLPYIADLAGTVSLIYMTSEDIYIRSCDETNSLDRTW